MKVREFSKGNTLCLCVGIIINSHLSFPLLPDRHVLLPMNEMGSQFPQLSLHLALYFLLLHFLWISFLVLLFIFFSHQRVFLSPHGSGGDGLGGGGDGDGGGGDGLGGGCDGLGGGDDGLGSGGDGPGGGCDGLLGGGGDGLGG